MVFLRRDNTTGVPRIGKKHHQGMVDHSCKNQAVAGHLGCPCDPEIPHEMRIPCGFFSWKKKHLFSTSHWELGCVVKNPSQKTIQGISDVYIYFFPKTVILILEFRFSQMGLYMAVGSFLSDTAAKGQAAIIPLPRVHEDVSSQMVNPPINGFFICLTRKIVLDTWKPWVKQW